MEKISEDTIIEASEGDVEAFEALYNSCSGYVYNVAWRIVNSHEDAEEIVQEAFFIIYRKLKSFRSEASFKTWVYRIATNTAIDYLRKITANRRKFDAYKQQQIKDGNTNEIDRRIDEEYQEKLVNEILGNLSPEQKACMVLRNVEGMSYQEIAEALNININTVRTRLKRARETLLTYREEMVKNEL